MKSNLTTLPEWLTQRFFIGSDNEEESTEEDAEDEDSEDEDEDEDSEDSGSDEDSEEDGEDEDEDKQEEDPSAGLKSALRKEQKSHKVERRSRIAAENRAKEAEAKLAATDGKENEALSTVQKELESERTKVTSLATKIKDQAVQKAIIAEATRQKFIDPEDALAIAKEIEADQDPEDPTDIDIDEDSVRDAVEKLAQKKKHLVSGPVKKPASSVKSGTKSTRGRKKKVADKGYNPADYPSLV